MEKDKLETAKCLALREMFYHAETWRDGGCWKWPKYKDAKGYGVIMFDGFHFSVHRLSFEHYKGKIPPDFVVMHECDIPACFNPKHLFLGSHSDNMQDMVRKGRQRKPKAIRDEARNMSWAWRNPA